MEIESLTQIPSHDTAYDYSISDENEALKVAQEALQYRLFNKTPVPFPEPLTAKFTFIDLFAGIGGFRVAMQSLGGKCVFTSEWDEKSQITYKANFGDAPFGDITKTSKPALVHMEFAADS